MSNRSLQPLLHPTFHPQDPPSGSSQKEKKGSKDVAPRPVRSTPNKEGLFNLHFHRTISGSHGSPTSIWGGKTYGNAFCVMNVCIFVCVVHGEEKEKEKERKKEKCLIWAGAVWSGGSGC